MLEIRDKPHLKPLRVTALTSGRKVPSSRFRIRQHIGPMNGHGIHVREIMPLIDRFRALPIEKSTDSPWLNLSLNAAWKGIKALANIPGVLASGIGDITWLERGFCPGILSLEGLICRPYALDIDDAVWLNPPWGLQAVRTVARRAAVVIAGNATIADRLCGDARSIRIVPTAVDTDIIRPHPDRRREPSRPFRVGWIGTSGNYRYLYDIERPLYQFLTSCRAELMLMADAPPRLRIIPPEVCHFVPWSEPAEPPFFHQIDLGIMPLLDDPWSRGKCSFKMLQFMAAGLPVVAAPVGMNADVLEMGASGIAARNDGDWYEALRLLYHDTSLSAAMGREGRRIVERHFSRRRITRKLAAIFRSLA